MFPWQQSSILPRWFRIWFAFCAFLMVVQLAIFGYAAIKFATSDLSGGIKPVIETIWCGKPGCSENSK